MAFLELGDHRLSRGDVQDLLATDHPMVEQFRFDKQNEAKGQRVDFGLVIVPKRGVRYLQQRDSSGRRVEPAWRKLSGREGIGQGNRSIWVSGGEMQAANHTFFPNQEFNDLGIGSALYVAMERLYRQLGVRMVSLLAVDVGVYVWARQAFAFQDPTEVDSLIPPLERFLHGHGAPVAVDEDRLVESWDFANYDVPDLSIDDYRVGKAFMLDCVSGWYGVKYLDDEKHSRVAEASRRETFARLPDKIDGASADLAVR
ncbi:MAG: hypothetical protein JRI23_11590 [Deltaproteobacteria bacterium]|jgi:hypothetical protein|nr:hypothetical protein [Deltaproteobacteria bacterium]MBW2532341.1 hypothetical protein [Deltaproteobacteria bacterium]